MVRGLAAGWLIAQSVPVLLAWSARDAAAERSDGAALFSERCAVCHQAQGEGVAGMFPPINQTLGRFLIVPAGRNYLADVALFGLAGTITVGGQRYVGQMKVAPPLTDQEAAAVLNYVLTTFDAESLPAEAAPYAAAEIAARRATPKSPTELAKLRQEIAAELERLGMPR
jgi:mono/diheme cytochrome c family protein